MKKLVCEMCGSSDLLKQDGVFVCQGCGCKYSVEEARKMMVEDGETGGPAPAPAAGRAVNQTQIDNYLSMAKSALEGSNNEEAENYANKIIEIDPLNWQAWSIKGTAAGWQTTGRNNRYGEGVVAWIKALTYVPEEERSRLRITVTVAAQEIGAAIVQMHGNHFVDYRSEDNKDDVLNAAKYVKDQLKILKEQTEVEVFTDDFSTRLGRILNGAAVGGSNNADEEFGPEDINRGKYEWERYTQSSDRCLKLLEQAFELSYDDELNFTISKNYVAIATTTRDSCSYKFVPNPYTDGSYQVDYTFTDGAKKIRTSSIETWQKRVSWFDPELRKIHLAAVLKQCEEGRIAFEEEAARAQYWSQHADEKAALEEERRTLTQQADQLEADLAAEPVYGERDRKREQIDSLNQQKQALGLFKGKEKKAVQEQIDQAQGELDQIAARIGQMEEACSQKLRPLRSRATEIGQELTCSRGRLPMTHTETVELLEGGQFKGSPMEILARVQALLPQGYRAGKEEGEAAITNNSKALHELGQAFAGVADALSGRKSVKTEWVDDPNQDKDYRIYMMKGEEGTGIYLSLAAKSIHQPCTGSCYIGINNSFSEERAADFVLIVSRLLFAALPTSDLEALQTYLAQALYGLAEPKELYQDGVRLWMRRRENANLKFEAL